MRRCHLVLLKSQGYSSKVIHFGYWLLDIQILQTFGIRS
jgi:hypothetical protein